MSVPPQKSLKVLMIGGGEAFHLEPLARCIRAACPTIHLGVFGLVEVKADGSRNYPKTSPVFDAVYQFPWNNNSCPPAQPSIKQQKKSAPNHHPIWMHCAKLFYRSIRRTELQRFRRYFEPLKNEVDIIHLQGLFSGPAFQWLLTNPDIPVVVSCWGSDVLRQSDIFVTLTQQQILRFASAITVTGKEFREVVLSKYGRDLSAKIHETFFDAQVKEFVESDRLEASQRFCARWNVPPDRSILCLGHNGAMDNQHIDLIRSIGRIKKDKKDTLFVVVPMTYGASGEYQDLVNQTLQAEGLSGIVLKTFLSDDELKDLRLATDILVYAPVSDAFSSSVSQAIASGSAAILGSWLPYKARRRAGFKYWEIDSPSQTCQVLESIIEDWPQAQLHCEPNRKLSAEFFSQEHIGQQWINTYESAIQNFNNNS